MIEETKLSKLANKVFKYLIKYLREFEKERGYSEFLYIIDDVDGSIVTFSSSIKKLKENVRCLREK